MCTMGALSPLGLLDSLRTRMRSDERDGKSAVFLCRPDRTTMPRSQRGGYGMGKTSNAAKPLSSICLNRLWLAVLKRPSRCGRGRKAGDVSAPPPKQGGHAVACSGILRHTSTRPHGVAHVLIYPCGKACGGRAVRRTRPQGPARLL